MKSYDFYACIWHGCIYCNECLPDGTITKEVNPIFANSEWDYIPICCICGKTHDYMTILD